MKPHPRLVLFSLLAFGFGVASVTSAAEVPPAAPAEALPAPARVAPVYVGVELLPVDASTRALFKVPPTAGLFVIGVAPGSSADGKLAQGDILLRLGDQVLVNREQLRALVRARKVGETVAFTVLRGGREETIALTMTAVPALAAPVPMPGPGAFPELDNAEDLLRRLQERAGQMMQDRPVTDSASAAGAAFGARRATLADRVTLGGGLSVVSTRTRVTGDGSVTVVEADGRKTVVVKDPSGKVLVEGELNEELRGKVPEWAAALIDAKAPPSGVVAPVAGGVRAMTEARS